MDGDEVQSFIEASSAEPDPETSIMMTPDLQAGCSQSRACCKTRLCATSAHPDNCRARRTLVPLL